MNKILKAAIVGAVKTVLPTENVEAARATRNKEIKNLSWTEKLNYKLHDKSTWALIAILAFYGYTGNWAGFVAELAPTLIDIAPDASQAITGQ